MLSRRPLSNKPNTAFHIRPDLNRALAREWYNGKEGVAIQTSNFIQPHAALVDLKTQTNLVNTLYDNGEGMTDLELVQLIHKVESYSRTTRKGTRL